MLKAWFSLRLHVQLALASGILLAITIAVATWFNVQSQKQDLVQNISREAISIANNLSIIGSYLLITNKLDELESLLVQLASFPSIKMLRVMSADGQMLSHVKKLESGEIITVYELSKIQMPATAQKNTFTKIDWVSNQLTIWHPIKTSTLLGWVKMEVSLDNVIKLQEQAIIKNIEGAIIAIFFDIFILLAILFVPARSFKKVVNFANCMTDKPGTKMDFHGGSYEINNLIKALNNSSSKLAIQREEINQQADSLIKLNNSLEQRVKNKTESLERINNSLSLFNSAVEQNPNITIITDNNGIIRYVNPAFTIITGYTAEEAIGKTPEMLKSDEMPNEFCQDLWSIIHSGKTWSGLIHNKKKNGGIYLSQTQISPIKDSLGEIKHFLSIQADVTETRQMEEQLRRSQKMEALGKLTGGIAHDYNNMLGIILGYADMLENALGKQPKLAEYAKKIHHAGERGAELTQKLLRFSRHKIQNAKSLDINALLVTEQLMLEKTLTARIKLALNLEDDLWSVWLDSGDLENAVLNMSINAMHAMDAGGQLTITTANEHINEVDARILKIAAGDYVSLNIIDTGCGMDEVTKEKIFDPFFSTKGDEGTGLGLSQVYGFVERSGGAIKVYSEPGHGTRFTLYFPRYHNIDTNAQAAIINAGQNLQGSETLLVVDDEQTIVELANDILTEQGYNVLTANDGEQALAILEKESVDMLITDVIMPNMDGYQLATLVQQRYPNIKIQLASGFADERHNRVADDLLKQNILQKPYSSKSLLEHVRSLLDEHSENIDLANRIIMVMDDEDSIRDLFSLNLAKLGCKTIPASDGEQAFKIYQQSLQKGEPVDAIIMDLSIPGRMGGRQLADKILAIDPGARMIVTSGHSDVPEMTHYQDYGFQGALDKDFNREKIKQVLEQVFSLT